MHVHDGILSSFPWFPFYPGAWLGSETITMMNISEEGAYHRLLCYAWRNVDGMLPNDEATLRGLAKWNGGDFQKVMGAFHLHPKSGRLFNARLYQEWRRAKHLIAEKRRAANTRWDEVRAQRLKTHTTRTQTKTQEAALSPIPTEWQANESHAKLAKARGLDVNIEAAHFKGKAQEKQWTTKDWDLKFRNWLLQEIKFREARRQP